MKLYNVPYLLAQFCNGVVNIVIFEGPFRVRYIKIKRVKTYGGYGGGVALVNYQSASVGDRADPRTKRRFFTQLRQIHPRGNKRVLTGVLRGKLVFRDLYRCSHHRFFVASDKLAVCVVITEQRHFNERRIVISVILVHFFSPFLSVSPYKR